MKILTRKQFLAIEHEVVYSKYSPCCLDELNIKCGNSGTNDFVEAPIVDCIDAPSTGSLVDLLHKAAENPGEFSMPVDFNCTGRDGLFDQDQLFAVWEPQDVEALIVRLQEVLKTVPKESHANQ